MYDLHASVHIYRLNSPQNQLRKIRDVTKLRTDGNIHVNLYTSEIAFSLDYLDKSVEQAPKVPHLPVNGTKRKVEKVVNQPK